MSAQKYILCTVVLTLAVLAVNLGSVVQADALSPSYASGNKSHHLIVGSRLPGDRLVRKEVVQKNSSWMKVVVVEKMFNATRNERITQVAALDQKTNGNGAFASLTGGGPGSNNVTLRFKSQRGHGINFMVEIYARY